MYYQVPTTKPEPHKHSTVFPWEQHAPKPTRVFAEEPAPEEIHQDAQEPHQGTQQEVPRESEESPAEPQNQLFQPNEPPPSGPLYTRVPYAPSASSYQTYNRSNAWDEDPEIQRYIETVQQARRAKTQVVSPGSEHSSPSETSRPSTKITDFPTEVERPSLPVTPAPIHRTLSESSDALPSAEDVPNQEDWVGVTVDVFSSLLGATYLLWRSTESPGDARGAAAEAVGSFGGSGAAL
jgi:glycogenin glucosyltransferase